MVEYSSPNTNKPLHLGHVRNNLLGVSVANLYKAAGYEVVMANLVNDRGIHICKSMIAWQKFGNSETPESTGIKGDHLVGKYYVIFENALRDQTLPVIETAIYGSWTPKAMSPNQNMWQFWVNCKRPRTTNKLPNSKTISRNWCETSRP